jgi:nicotinate-nucleotide adenylyltransferase
MRAGLPLAPPGLRVGLLGGSFDPAHQGHVRITEEALRRFRLDRIWWLVSPGNPLKPHGPAPLTERMAPG